MTNQTVQLREGAWDQLYADRPWIAAWIGIARIAHTLEQSTMAMLAEKDLTPGQYDALQCVVTVPGLNQQELAGRLSHSKANVSQLITKLEQQRLVKRVPDGRAYRLHPTDKGSAVVSECEPRLEQLLFKQFAELSAGDRKILRQLLEDTAAPARD